MSALFKNSKMTPAFDPFLNACAQSMPYVSNEIKRLGHSVQTVTLSTCLHPPVI